MEHIFESLKPFVSNTQKASALNINNLPSGPRNNRADYVIHQNRKCPIVEKKKIISEGYPCGEYSAFVYEGVPLLQLNIRASKPITLIGDFENVKYDRLSGVIFIQTAWGNRSAFYSFELGSEDSEGFFKISNELYWNLMLYDYSLRLEIDEGFLIAKYQKTNIIIADIVDRGKYFMITGYSNESIRVPKRLQQRFEERKVMLNDSYNESEKDSSKALCTSEFGG